MRRDFRKHKQRNELLDAYGNLLVVVALIAKKDSTKLQNKNTGDCFKRLLKCQIIRDAIVQWSRVYLQNHLRRDNSIDNETRHLDPNLFARD